MINPINGYCFVYGDSNFDHFNEYPKHKCGWGPTKPDAYATFGRQIYNEQKRNYELEMLRYTSFIKQYIEAAKNDIKRIQEIINGTVDEYNLKTY